MEPLDIFDVFRRRLRLIHQLQAMANAELGQVPWADPDRKMLADVNLKCDTLFSRIASVCNGEYDAKIVPEIGQ